MKKIPFRIIAISLVLFSSFMEIAEAGESKTIAVSCTIPAIPGVNVPPFNTQANTQNASAIQQESKEERNKKETAEVAIAKQPEKISQQDARDGKMMQTVYSR